MPELEQSFFQVRLGWGAAGFDRLARSEIIVLVDVLGLSAAAERAVAGGDALALTSCMSATDAAAVARVGASGAMVIAGCLRNAAAVARVVLAEQTRLAGRAAVAVIPLGSSEWEHADVRVRVTDQLGAGAVVAALGDVGIDHTSPEAAMAGEGFRALRRAVRHMVLAATETQQLIAAGGPSAHGEQGARHEQSAAGTHSADAVHEAIAHASEVDAGDAVPVLRGQMFVPLMVASWPPADQPA